MTHLCFKLGLNIGVHTSNILALLMTFLTFINITYHILHICDVNVMAVIQKYFNFYTVLKYKCSQVTEYFNAL